ncbi:forkhead-associated domain-containing protein 1 isoform X2 [Hemiscyllium ocellatum]|uniref:forkhead-associated domain-containing protein 1 isoform X2 n=1 Tax=Hemiscyllium ocellatum TaxID=170820 RepID=UPI0029669264|nr:forkhead-associated domain-containing protein 1 isoform X2 [Hemiscyllium ocellatum]
MELVTLLQHRHRRRETELGDNRLLGNREPGKTNRGIDDRHALIELNDSENCFVVQDLNSSNGTFVNDCRIQNAAVRLAPGDVLRFGIGGDTYELLVETVPSMFCPPVSQRSAWPGHLQIIEDSQPHSCPVAVSQLPWLPTQSSSSGPNGWIQGNSATIPHPPLKKRAASAGSKRVTSAPPIGTSSSSSPPTLRRGAWTNTPGRSVGNGVPFCNSQNQEMLLQEKEHQILRLGDEIIRLSVFESESKRKDTVIASLRDEVSALKLQLSQVTPSQSDLEITQQLLTLGCDIEAKQKQIETLKDEITKLQKGPSEVMQRSLTEKDLEIMKLKSETEELKKDNNILSGLVTSLQRDITAKDQQLLQLQAEGEKLRAEIRDKEGQLVAMSAKFSRLRESRDHQEELVSKEKELVTHRHNATQLESRMKELESEVKQLRSQQDDMKTSASEEKQVREQLQDELERTRLLLQEMGRRERLVRVDLEQAQAKLERFRSRIMQTTYSAPGVQSPTEALSDEQVIEQMKHIIDEREELKEKLQGELDGKVSKEEKWFTNTEDLRRALDEMQARLQTDFGNRVKEELEMLQELSVDQNLLWVQKAVAGILSLTLSWQQQSEQSLLDIGIDTSSYEGGMVGYLQQLQAKLHGAEEQIKTLQGQADQEQRSWESESKELLNELKAEWERQMAEEIRHSQAEVQERHDQQLAEVVAQERERGTEAAEEEKRKREEMELRLKELNEQLAEVVAQERERGTEAVEEEKRKREEMELRLKELNEDMKVKDQEIEALKQQMSNMSQELKGARKIEVDMHQELEAQQSRQKAEVEGLRHQIDQDRRGHLDELAEFKEQIRQHSRTIVALEERLLTVTKQLQAGEEEKGILSGKLREAKGKLDKWERNRTVRQPVQSPPAVAAPNTPDTHAQEQACAVLQKELAEARVQVLAQQDVILGLRRDLAGANARMSDMAGELSERQKVELEQNRVTVKSQELELNTLRQHLAKMSQLVDMKSEELQSRNGELRSCKEKLEQLKAARKEKAMQCEKLQHELNERDSQQHQASIHTEDNAHSEIVMLAAQCKGHRHEEVIQRQREALAELRARVKVLEQIPTSSKGISQEQASQHLTVLKKELTDLQSQRALSRSESFSNSSPSNDSAKLKQKDSFCISEASIDRTARLEMSEALDLSERTYLDLVKALSSLLSVKELSGSLSLKHIPRDEMVKLGKVRHRNLELVNSRITQLKGQLQRKDELLGEYENDLQQLSRRSEVTRHKCQANVESLQEQLQRQIEENNLIRESLERTQSRLDQEKRLNKVIKQHKTFHLEQIERRATKCPSHSCTKEDIHGKAEYRKKMMREKLKKKDYEIETLKRELRKQDQELCDTTTQLVNLQNSMEMKRRQLPEE